MVSIETLPFGPLTYTRCTTMFCVIVMLVLYKYNEMYVHMYMYTSHVHVYVRIHMYISHAHVRLHMYRCIMLPRCEMPRPMGSTRFRIPPALSSVLTAFRTLQLRAVGILNHVYIIIDPLVLSSNYYYTSL